MRNNRAVFRHSLGDDATTQQVAKSPLKESLHQYATEDGSRLV